MKTEDAKNVQEEPGFSFSWALKGERLEREDAPWLLGRDVRYELTVNTVNLDGNPMSGIKYRLKVNPEVLSKYRISISEVNQDVVSTMGGNAFAIFAELRANAANYEHTNVTFEISLESEGGVVQKISFAMGRLAQWSLLSLGEADSLYYLFTATSSWAGEGNAGYWDWDRIPIGWCDISIPALELVVKASSADYAEDGGLRLYHRVYKKSFTGLADTDVKVNYGPAFSKNGYSGTLPHTHVFQLPESRNPKA